MELLTNSFDEQKITDFQSLAHCFGTVNGLFSIVTVLFASTFTSIIVIVLNYEINKQKYSLFPAVDKIITTMLSTKKGLLFRFLFPPLFSVLFCF